MSRREELFELTRVRVLLFLREPEALFWVFAFPALLAAVLGFAFRRGEVKPSSVGVVGGAEVAALEERLQGVDHLESVRFELREEAERALRKGRIDALVLPGEPPTVRMDPHRPEAEAARLRILRALEPPRADGGAPPIAFEEVKEAGSRYVDFLFPGLIGMNIMGTGMWVIGFAVAELRQRKVLRRLLVTPMRRSSFLGSFLLARLVFLALEVGALAAFGTWILGVPFRGGVVSFALLSLISAACFAGLGLLVTARTKTIQGASGMLNLAMVPMWLVGGIFFSYERFPEALHPLLRFVPLTALNDALRAVCLDGAGLVSILPELGVQVLWGVVAFAIALRIFRWE